MTGKAKQPVPDSGDSPAAPPEDQLSDGTTGNDLSTEEPTGEPQGNQPLTDMPAAINTENKPGVVTMDAFEQFRQSMLETMKQTVTEAVQTVQDAMNGKVGALTAQLNQAQADSREKTAVLNRLQLLTKEFPQLLDLEVDGLLPAGDNPEELRPKFQKMADRFKTQAARSVEQKLEGAAPPPPTGNKPAGLGEPSMTEDKMFQELQRLASSRNPGDEEKYFELQAQYDQFYLTK